MANMQACLLKFPYFLGRFSWEFVRMRKRFYSKQLHEYNCLCGLRIENSRRHKKNSVIRWGKCKLTVIIHQPSSGSLLSGGQCCKITSQFYWTDYILPRLGGRQIEASTGNTSADFSDRLISLNERKNSWFSLLTPSMLLVRLWQTPL